MTFEQTVEIPENRRLTIVVPKEFPAGAATLTFTPKAASPADGKTAQARLEEAIETACNLAKNSHFSNEALFEERRRMTPREAIEKCRGIAKGVLSSDEIIAMRRRDKEFEDAQRRRLFSDEAKN
jgi:hypothetical protein